MVRAPALVLGVVTLASVVLLLAWDVTPKSFPDSAHLVLGAIPLALIAVSYLVYQLYVRPRQADLIRAIILGLAFLCWAEISSLVMVVWPRYSTTWRSPCSSSTSS